jgi:hypothetical protein
VLQHVKRGSRENEARKRDTGGDVARLRTVLCFSMPLLGALSPAIMIEPVTTTTMCIMTIWLKAAQILALLVRRRCLGEREIEEVE